MKLASLKEGGRDGTLIVVDRALKHAVRAGGIASTLQKAIEDWAAIGPKLQDLADKLRDNKAPGASWSAPSCRGHSSRTRKL